MTATLPPLGPTADTLTWRDPRWDLPETVHFIALGPEWPDEVRALWATVTVEAHDSSHDRPVFNCPACPQTVDCPSCGFPALVCEDPSGHARVRKAGDVSLLIGSATYGRERAR